jgi:hypothetical protein
MASTALASFVASGDVGKTANHLVELVGVGSLDVQSFRCCDGTNYPLQGLFGQIGGISGTLLREERRITCTTLGEANGVGKW